MTAGSGYVLFLFMSTSADAMAVLRELTQLGMDVVRRVHDAVLATEDDPQRLCQLTEAYCDAGRGVRQTLALRMRIESGSFAVVRAPRAGRDPDAEPAEALDRPERPERWNEYERPDWETHLYLTGDPAIDEPAIEAAVHAAVVRIRKTYARGLKVLEELEPRRAELTTVAPLRLDDSS